MPFGKKKIENEENGFFMNSFWNKIGKGSDFNNQILDRINPYQRVVKFHEGEAEYLDFGHCKLNVLPNDFFTFIMKGVLERMLDNGVESFNLGDSDIFSDIKDLIVKNKIEQALDEVRNFAFACQLHDETNEIVVIMANYQRLKRQDVEGLISYSDSNVQYNKINLTLLQALSRIKSNFANDFSSSQSQNSLVKINDLRGLKVLSLKNTSISSLDFLEDKAWSHSPIEEINLDGNPITDIKPLLNLPNLKKVIFSPNQQLNIPSDIAAEGNMDRIRAYFQSFKEEINERGMSENYTQDRLINIHSGNFELNETVNIYGGDSIIQKGTINLKSSDLLQDSTKVAIPDERISAEIKLILVGNSSAGKTSLAKMLMGEAFPKTHDSTHGISIRRWQPSVIDFDLPINTPLTVNIWDFGGQEYYHGTHRLFLNNNAIYILMFDPLTNTPSVSAPTDEQRDEHFNYRYWLDNIRFYAPDSPIIVIKNKTDLDPDNKVRFEGKDRDIYGIDNVHELSLEEVNNKNPRETRRYKRFMDELMELVTERTTRAPWTMPWVKTRQYLQDNQKKTQEITDNPFAKWRNEKPVVDLKTFEKTYLKIHKDLTPNVSSDFNYHLDTLNLLTLLHMSGNILYYEKDAELTWVTDNIYKVLNSNVLADKGNLSRKDVVEQVGEEWADDFIKIMRRFEVIFELANTTDKVTFVAPQYLSLAPPMPDLFRIATTGLTRQSTFFVRMPLFSYRKLIHRLILFYGSDAMSTPIFWKNGILLVHESDQRILIKGEQKSEYFGDIFGEISVSIEASPTGDVPKRMEEIFATFQDLMKKEFVIDESPTADPFSRNNMALSKYQNDLKLSLNGIDFVDLKTLKNESFKILVPSDSGKQLKINDFRPFVKRNDIQRPLSIFISYSHVDTEYMNRLNVHLAPLKRTEKIENWTDKALLAGENWDNTIKEQLAKSDIILLLLSADFIASRYIWEVELNRALEQEVNKKTRVIPILIRDCFYTDLSFTAKNIIPQNSRGKLISVRSWLNGNEDEALSIIAEQINRVVEDVMKTAI
jgi:internalin A